MTKVVYFWGGSEPITRIIIVGTLAYLGLVLILRISGKRTIASMNAFDFIVTVAIGSVFGRALTAKTVSIAEALTAFALLALLQFVFSYLEIRIPFFKKLVTSSPRLLFHNGRFIKKNLRKERLDQNELVAAVRKKGFSSMEKVAALILETDGSFSVIGKHDPVENPTYTEF